MKKILALAIMLNMVTFAAWALDLQSARVQGLVGETRAGYVAPLGGGADVSNLTAEVNNKRRAEYKRISAENGQPVDVVAKLAFPQIVANLPSGAKYQDSNGSWVTK